jgi:hypothetical protein
MINKVNEMVEALRDQCDLLASVTTCYHTSECGSASTVSVSINVESEWLSYSARDEGEMQGLIQAIGDLIVEHRPATMRGAAMGNDRENLPRKATIEQWEAA